MYVQRYSQEYVRVHYARIQNASYASAMVTGSVTKIITQIPVSYTINR